MVAIGRSRRGPQQVPIEKRFWARVLILSDEDCWEWQGALCDGYGKVMVRKEGKKRPDGTHRVAWELSYGLIPVGLCVCHKCDNRKCVNPLHLFLGTHADNAADKVRKGRCPRGDAHPSTKLTARDRLAVLESAMLGITLADEYGVSPSTISKIRTEAGYGRRGPSAA